MLDSGRSGRFDSEIVKDRGALRAVMMIWSSQAARAIRTATLGVLCSTSTGAETSFKISNRRPYIRVPSKLDPLQQYLGLHLRIPLVKALSSSSLLFPSSSAYFAASSYR
jgi:hypothetical protein